MEKHLKSQMLKSNEKKIQIQFDQQQKFQIWN